MKVITRFEAMRSRSKRYFTGVPCKNGHVCERRVADWKCVCCSATLNSHKYHTNPEFKQRVKDGLVRRRFARMDKDRARLSEYYRNNPDLRAFNVARGRAKKRKRMPAWADKELIRDVYRTAQRVQRSTGVKMSVDHVIPLRGKFVSGLHVHTNLQIISVSANCRKSNKF